MKCASEIEMNPAPKEYNKVASPMSTVVVMGGDDSEHPNVVGEKEQAQQDANICGVLTIHDKPAQQAHANDAHHSHDHSQPPSKEIAEHGHSHGDSGSSIRITAQQAWVFTVAMSLHSALDGIGVGAVVEEHGFYALMAAVLAHKGFDGLALGTRCSHEF